MFGFIAQDSYLSFKSVFFFGWLLLSGLVLQSAKIWWCSWILTHFLLSLNHLITNICENIRSIDFPKCRDLCWVEKLFRRNEMQCGHVRWWIKSDITKNEINVYHLIIFSCCLYSVILNSIAYYSTTRYFLKHKCS